MKRLVCGAVSAWLLLHPSTVLGEGTPATLSQDDSCPRGLEERLRQVHEDQDNVGLSAVASLRGEVVLELYLGRADLEQDVSVDAETVFAIASVTKAVTGITLLRLVERGILSLDDPVAKWVPDPPFTTTPPLTVGQLVNHTSGIPHPRERTPELFATHYGNVVDAMEVYRDAELRFAPGSDYGYSSSNYNLLAVVIQNAAGKPFEEVVREEVLGPLDLARTRFNDVLSVVPGRSHRYSFYHPWTYAEADRLYRVPEWDYSFNQAGGNLLSTAADLVRFGEALVQPGYLSQAAHARLFRPVDPEGPSVWTFGWFYGEGGPAGPRLTMSGSNPGVQAALGVFPEHSLVISVLSNTWGRNARTAEMVDTLGFAGACMGWPDAE